MTKGYANVIFKCVPRDTSFPLRQGDWFHTFVTPLVSYGTLGNIELFADYFLLHFSRISVNNYQALLTLDDSNITIEHQNISPALLPRAVAIRNLNKPSSSTIGEEVSTTEQQPPQDLTQASQPSPVPKALKKRHNTSPLSTPNKRTNRNDPNCSSGAPNSDDDMSTTSLADQDDFMVQNTERRRLKLKAHRTQHRPVPGNLKPRPKIASAEVTTLLLRPTNTEMTLHKVKFQSLKRIFGNVVDTRLIRKGGLAIDLPLGTVIDEFLQLNSLNDIDITCNPPATGEFRSGIIGGVPLSFEPEDIFQLLNDDPLNSIPVTRVQRLGHPDEPSRTVKIVFQGKSLPVEVTLLNHIHPVLPYVAKPRQCFKCQRLFHTAVECRSKPRCLHCGAPHEPKDCPRTKTYCANCKGAHRANDVNCPVLKQAKQICKIKATENIPMVEAKAKVHASYAAAAAASTTRTKASQPTVYNPGPPVAISPSQALNFDDLLDSILALVQNFMGPNPARDTMLRSFATMAKAFLPGLLAASSPIVTPPLTFTNYNSTL